STAVVDVPERADRARRVAELRAETHASHRLESWPREVDHVSLRPWARRIVYNRDIPTRAIQLTGEGKAGDSCAADECSHEESPFGSGLKNSEINAAASF